jgi:hypothetical protein
VRGTERRFRVVVVAKIVQQGQAALNTEFGFIGHQIIHNQLTTGFEVKPLEGGFPNRFILLRVPFRGSRSFPPRLGANDPIKGGQIKNVRTFYVTIDVAVFPN